MTPENAAKELQQHDNNPMPIPQQPLPPTLQNAQQQSYTQPTNQLSYDSNPFTIAISGFQLLMKYAQSIVITILVLGLLSFAFQIIGQIASSFTQDSASAQQDDVSETLDSLNEEFQTDFNNQSEADAFSNSENEYPPVGTQTIVNVVSLAIGVMLVIFIVTLPLGVAFSAAFKGFIAAGTIAAIQHRSISFSEAFSAMWSRFTTLFVAELIAVLKIIGGYLLFIIPGVRAQLRYEALPYVIMNDPAIGAKAALSQTKELYRKHLMEVFGIRFFASIIPAIGQAFAAGGIGLSMQQLQAYKQAQLATPKTHWLNYLGLILFGVLLLIIASVVAVVVIALSSNR